MKEKKKMYQTLQQPLFGFTIPLYVQIDGAAPSWLTHQAHIK